jgi:hypothetical protein
MEYRKRIRATESMAFTEEGMGDFMLILGMGLIA